MYPNSPKGWAKVYKSARPWGRATAHQMTHQSQYSSWWSHRPWFWMKAEWSCNQVWSMSCFSQGIWRFHLLPQHLQRNTESMCECMCVWERERGRERGRERERERESELVDFGLVCVFVCANSFDKKNKKLLWNCPDNFIILYYLCICMNIKTSKLLIFLFLINIVTWIIFDWITNTKCFITAKSSVLANISAKNF